MKKLLQELDDALALAELDYAMANVDCRAEEKLEGTSRERKMKAFRLREDARPPA